MIVTLLMILAVISTVVLLAACRAASIADAQMERMARDCPNSPVRDESKEPQAVGSR